MPNFQRGPKHPRARHTPLSSNYPIPPRVPNPTVQTPSLPPKIPKTPFTPIIYSLFPSPDSSTNTHFSALMALSSSKVSSFNGFSLSPISGNGLKKLNLSSFCDVRVDRKWGSGGKFKVCAVTVPLTGVIFEPFEEVKKENLAVPCVPQVSLARQNFADECESVINEQINVEYNVSYVYHSMFAYFDRDNVALKGFAKFFKESSEEEREHAEKLMKYQNIRGGRVVLHPIKNVPSEFEHVEKGEALHAMELALSLEKLTNEKLLNVHSVANRNNDPEMTHFIESEFLAEQVESIKKISEYVSQLRRVGKGHGVWHFDQRLLHEEHAA